VLAVPDAQPVHEHGERVPRGESGARPGGIFCSPKSLLLRLLSLRLYRLPYYDLMKAVGKKLYDWGCSATWRAT
jgi:hypothetical protein